MFFIECLCMLESLQEIQIMRKMLGEISWPVTGKIMDQITTQSRETLALWAEEYSRTNYLPVYEKYHPGSDLAAGLLDSNARCRSGEIPLKEHKAKVNEVRKMIGKETDIIATASLRAVSTACAVMSTPTNSLGFLFYGCAAKAYDLLGLKASPEAYDEAAQNEMEAAYASLLAYSVKDEKKPVKISWNC